MACLVGGFFEHIRVFNHILLPIENGVVLSLIACIFAPTLVAALALVVAPTSDIGCTTCFIR